MHFCSFVSLRDVAKITHILDFTIQAPSETHQLYRRQFDKTLIIRMIIPSKAQRKQTKTDCPQAS